jgi:DNA-binding SARP family transcriptional activator
VRAAVPYDERAHRLAIAAHLATGDRSAAVAAGRATSAVLADLAVAPEPSTELLLRQVAAAGRGVSDVALRSNS